MSFRSLARDLRDSIGSLSRRSFDFRSNNHNHGKSRSAVHELHDRDEVVIQSTCWANLPPELLRDVIKRLEESETAWPARKHVVACAAVCRSWREMCKEIIQSPELCGKLTFPLSLKQPGPRDGTIQCFIQRNKSKLTYRLSLCLSPGLLVENGKFLLSAKRNRRTTFTEYVISTDTDNISRSSSGCIGKVRSNFLGTKFIIYDRQAPPNSTTTTATTHQPGSTSLRFNSKKVSPKPPPTGNYNIAQVAYELNVLGTRGPRKMQCVMHTIPTSSLSPGGTVPGRPELIARDLGDSFRSVSSSSSFKPVADRSTEFASARFSDIINLRDEEDDNNGDKNKEIPLVLKNKPPRWHEQLQCWCLNFRGRVTVASVKNFQLVAGNSNMLPNNSSDTGNSNSLQQSSSSSDQDKILLQFGKIGKDLFTMDYRYPLSAFQAFAICLTSFDTKLACE